MALETISQILSPTNATYVNGVSAERRFAAAVLANAYQGLVEKDGRGVDDKFVTEDDANSAAQVFVNRILPVKMKPREQGANKNGASFSANKHMVQTETVGIEILTVLDDTITIARARQDMIKVDLLAEQTKIYSDRLKTIINGATFAAKVLKVGVEEANGKEVNKVNITDDDITNKLVLTRFIEANSLLDEGDSEHGVDVFPEDTRVAVFKTSFRAFLKTSGILVIGGANAAYDIAKGNAISTGESARKSEDGFIGEIDGIPCHIISNESLAHASEFLGFPETELKNSVLAGYISSSWANARGVSTSKQTKIVDALDGQGVVLQPYTKFGVASWYAKGNVLITSKGNVNDGYYTPFAELKKLLGDKASQVTFKLKGAGSRLWATVPAGAITKSGTSITVGASVVALDDWDVDHVVGVYAMQYTAGQHTPCKSVSEFLHKYVDDDSSVDYTEEVTRGTAFDPDNSGYVDILIVADDGSCVLTGIDLA